MTNRPDPSDASTDRGASVSHSFWGWRQLRWSHKLLLRGLPHPPRRRQRPVEAAPGLLGPRSRPRGTDGTDGTGRRSARLPRPAGPARTASRRRGGPAICRPSPEGNPGKLEQPWAQRRGSTARVSFQCREWKGEKPFSYESIFLRGTLRKMLMWCLNTFYYNAINYIKTQLSHSFKILKYCSAKTQKDLLGAL